MKNGYLLTITYNFDEDYFTKFFENEKDAIKELKEMIDKEIKEEQLTMKYVPQMIKYDDTDIKLYYKNGDYAHYKIFEF